MVMQGELKLEINISLKQCFARSKGELIFEGGVISSEYGMGNSGWKAKVIGLLKLPDL